jgi:hypothetical protein
VLSDLAVLRDQGELFGSVASDPTLWRTLAGVDAHTRDRLAAARANTRRTYGRRSWLGTLRFPPRRWPIGTWVRRS